MASILVVDDEAPIRDVLARRLAQWGHQVTAVSTATAALDQMAAAPASIVFCDVIMPIHDGIWLLEEIRRRWPQTVVVMVSGAESLDTVIDSRRLGAVDWVAKPVGREMLHQALDRALAASAKLRDQNEN